jgi:hypothetical protein
MEGTKITLVRHDPASWQKPRGIYYPRSAQSFFKEFGVVGVSPEQALKELFPVYRIFRYREFDFRELDINANRYSGLVLSGAGEVSSEIGLENFRPSVRSVKRRTNSREFQNLSSEAIQIVDYVANYPVGAFANNSQKYRALAEILPALGEYLSTPNAEKCIEDSGKFISWWHGMCRRR